MSQRSQFVKHPERNRALTHDPDKLRWRRFRAELSIRDLASKSGVSIGSISMLERGAYAAKLKTLRDLATALDCDVADLQPDEPKGTAA